MSESSSINKDNHFYNVGLFIDYENICKILLKKQQNVIRLGFFEKIREWCKTHGRRIVKIAVYCNFDVKDLYESKHQSLLQSYGVETIHTSNQGKNYADLKIAIDVLNSMYTNDNIDEFIIMSNDKDMTPLLNTLRLNKRRASILTTGEEYNHAICEFADEQIRFEEIIETPYNKKLLISDIEDRYIQNIYDFVGKELEAYKIIDNEKKWYKKHYELYYYLPSQSDYYQVMQYELLNMIKNRYEGGEILLYKRVVKDNVTTINLLPSHYKQDFINLGIIKEDDILIGYDLDSIIRDKYMEYLPKK